MIFNSLAVSARHGIAHDRFKNHSCPPICRWCKREQKNLALGRSRGGFRRKTHARCDALETLRFILTGGQKSGWTQVLDLLAGLSGEAVLADKGYDADYIVEAVKDMDAMAVIPPRYEPYCSAEI